MKKHYNLIYIIFIISSTFLVNNNSLANDTELQAKNKKDNCVFHTDMQKTFDYKWVLSAFTNKYISPSPIKVNVIIERHSRNSEIKTLVTPFIININEDYSHISVSKEKEEKLWHIALQHVKVSKCNDKKAIVAHELSSTEPLIVFRPYAYRPNDGSSMKIIASPNKENIYNGNLKNHGGLVDFRNNYKGSKTYTYKYKYCPDSISELNLLNTKNKSSLNNVAKLSYCYIKSGKDYRKKLFTIIKFPLQYKMNGIDESSTTKIKEKGFLTLNFCCGDVKPSIVKDGYKGSLHRDRDGSGEGEYLYFEFDTKTNKWYLTGVGIDSY